jgi:hypothetical protein
LRNEKFTSFCATFLLHDTLIFKSPTKSATWSGSQRIGSTETGVSAKFEAGKSCDAAVSCGFSLQLPPKLARLRQPQKIFQ